MSSRKGRRHRLIVLCVTTLKVSATQSSTELTLMRKVTLVNIQNLTSK